MSISKRVDSLDSIQSSQYSFPYHYIPNAKKFPNFSESWAFAPSYIAALNIFSDWFSSIPKKGDHIHMDYGCGDGGFVNALASFEDHRAVKFSGIDYDENAVRWAYLFSNGDTEFTVGDIATLPSRKYDTGSLIEVYEHIPPSECPSFLKSISVSLKKGAPLFITVPSTQKPVGDKHYRHFDFFTLKNEFAEFFDVEFVFGFEKVNFLAKLLAKVSSTRWWYFETLVTNNMLVAQFQRAHECANGCGRLAMVVRNRD